MLRFVIMLLIMSLGIGCQSNLDVKREYNLEAPKYNKTALVIGNSNYDHLSEVNNAINDAIGIKRALERLGFEVIYGGDLSIGGMKSLLQKFGRRLRSKRGIGLFYYAGHGFQYEGENYLAAIDADSLDLSNFSLSLSEIQKSMELSEAQLSVAILDACRNEPGIQSWQRKNSRGVTRGLARINWRKRVTPSGVQNTLLAFSTAPGHVANDSPYPNDHGVYTKVLLKYIGKRGLTVNEIFLETANEVSRVTSGKQIPWMNSSLTKEFYFDDQAAMEAELCRRLEENRSYDLAVTYIDQYDDGRCFSLAKTIKEAHEYKSRLINANHFIDFNH